MSWLEGGARKLEKILDAHEAEALLQAAPERKQQGFAVKMGTIMADFWPNDPDDELVSVRLKVQLALREYRRMLRTDKKRPKNRPALTARMMERAIKQWAWGKRGNSDGWGRKRFLAWKRDGLL